MIISCEECGKRYKIEPDKIKGDKAKFKCKNCGNLIEVEKPAPPSEEFSEPSPVHEPEEESPVETPKEEPEPEKPKPEKAKKPKAAPTRIKGIGLRGKLMFFLLVPLVIAFALGAFFSLRQLMGLTNLFIMESSKIVTQMAEKQIADNARAVATQVKLYLDSHPDLQKQNFNNNKEFRNIAVQKVGLTGYTSLYELPAGPDGVWKTWADINPDIIGVDMSSLKKSMGKNFRGFWKIFTGVKIVQESSGYYSWQDPDGLFREKFMFCAPVEGYPYYIYSSTYLDEFTLPVKRLERSSEKQAMRVRNINAGVMISIIVIVGLIVFFYGRSLTGNIRSLSEVADRISVGELDAEVEVKSKDELGELASAISRMQDSLRLSIERLRRRR